MSVSGEVDQVFENYVVAADITLISLSAIPPPTYNYFWFPSAILNLQVL